MRLILLRLVFFVSVALAAPGFVAAASQSKNIGSRGTGGQKLYPQEGIFVKDGTLKVESRIDSPGRNRDSISSQKIISRNVQEARYIYESLGLCNTCKCGSTCPRKDYFAIRKEYCVQCFEECKACSCEMNLDQPDKISQDFGLVRYVEPACSSKCAKKCQAKRECQNCSCDPNSVNQCLKHCRKCPAEGTKDFNQRCDLCPFRGCVDNVCPCYGWCTRQQCIIFNPDGSKNLEQCNGIAETCTGYCQTLHIAYNEPAILYPGFYGEKAMTETIVGSNDAVNPAAAVPYGEFTAAIGKEGSSAPPFSNARILAFSSDGTQSSSLPAVNHDEKLSPIAGSTENQDSILTGTGTDVIGIGDLSIDEGTYQEGRLLWEVWQ